VASPITSAYLLRLLRESRSGDLLMSYIDSDESAYTKGKLTRVGFDTQLNLERAAELINLAVCKNAKQTSA
jgi:hypothetical protein